MKRTLSFMVMAFALLLTQCRKPEVKFPSPVAPEGTTVSMTVTAGPGSKTNIDADGRITWSSGDKLYVGDGSKCIGCLTLTSGADNPTGTFSGNVTLTKDTRGEQTFHFYYLGRAERTLENDGTSVEVSFAEQTGLLNDLGSCHVGYGSAAGTVKDGIVTGINVMLVSKVALARFSFTESDSKGAYDGALILSGTNIYNKMTVNFNSSTGFSFSGAPGAISLRGSHSERYVMLVPAGTSAAILNFGGGAKGMTTLDGIEANKFYGRDGAIEVTVKPFVFTVDDEGTTVEFAPGNLWYGKADGETTAAFHFETNQWDFSVGEWNESTEKYYWDANHVSHFFWSATESVAYAASYSDESASTSDVFFTNSSSFQVAGETAGTWRTLSKAEWKYLLDTRTNASSLRAWKELDDGTHNGLVILPDGTENPSTVMSGITSTSHLASSGAVFLPTADNRNGTVVNYVGSGGYYWSSTPSGDDEDYACSMCFNSGNVRTNIDYRDSGYAVRLVR